MSGLYTNILNLYKTNMKTDGNDTFDFDRDLNENWDKIDANAKVLDEALEAFKKGDSFPLFFAHEFDHVLTGDEALGWAFQGSLVTMVYPDAVARVLEEFNSGADGTIRGIVCKRASNGHLIADISQKVAIDALYSSTGVAEFYVLDSVNQQFYLPRNDWFIQGTSEPDKVNQFNEAGLPNITSKIGIGTGIDLTSTGAFFSTNEYRRDGIGSTQGPAILNFDASRSSDVYGKSSTVQPPASLKLVYYKVGNTVVNESLIDVGQVLSELNLKADIDLSNVVPNQDFKDMSMNWAMPDFSKKVNKSVNTSYVAEKDGFLICRVDGSAVASVITINNMYVATSINAAGFQCVCNCPVAKGDTYKFEQSGGSYIYGYFVPLKGAQ